MEDDVVLLIVEFNVKCSYRSFVVDSDSSGGFLHTKLWHSV